MLLTEILPQAASLHGGSPAVVCGATRLSYAALAGRVARLAAALHGLGLGPGDRIASLHRNCHRMLELYFASVHAGAVLVPLNHRLSARDLAYILTDTEARVLVADDGWDGLALEALEMVDAPCRLVWSRPGDPRTTGGGADDYHLLVGGGEPCPLPEVPASVDDAVNIYYTSGTTGHHKGVVLTHRNIASHALATVADLELGHGDVWAHVAPMFHLADAWATWAITLAGGRHVMVGRFRPELVLRAFAEHGVTVTNLVPTMLTDLVNCPAAEHLRVPALRLVMSGGAPITPALVRRVVDVFRCEYVQTYGLTETSPYLTYSLLGERHRRQPVAEQLRRRSMTGRPARGVRLRVVDDQGRDVAADGHTVGEIVARSDRITPGYWRLPEATAEAFRGGWFHTGDLATIDREGWIDIVDRAKDVIITGGELVYSTEVENALAEHPAVLASAVIGLADERLGERVHAAVVPRTGETVTPAELIEHCRGRLAHFKCPHTVDLMAELPRTGSGKISKTTLRGRYARQPAE